MIIYVRESIPQYPRHPGDIGDIGDIFRKSLKLLDFLNGGAGDISGDIFGDGDSRAQDTLACALHRSIRWHRRERPKLPL